jgi:hypothetical protein
VYGIRQRSSRAWSKFGLGMTFRLVLSPPIAMALAAQHEKGVRLVQDAHPARALDAELAGRGLGEVPVSAA